MLGATGHREAGLTYGEIVAMILALPGRSSVPTDIEGSSIKQFSDLHRYQNTCIPARHPIWSFVGQPQLYATRCRRAHYRGVAPRDSPSIPAPSPEDHKWTSDANAPMTLWHSSLPYTSPCVDISKVRFSGKHAGKLAHCQRTRDWLERNSHLPTCCACSRTPFSSFVL